MQTWVGLLDCNNFFVSCERLFRPDLKNRPVLVLSSNDGCVVARSKEIKDNGIPMGVPYFQIKDIIKDIDAVTFSSHFALYRDISRRVFEVMRMELEEIEQYSVDEAFFVIVGSETEIEKRVRALKDKVERVVGIPVSIGIASSKTQAKYAGSVAKKTNGVCVMPETAWRVQLREIRLEELWGVGRSSFDAYRKKNIITAYDLLQLERRQVQSLFGVHGERLWLELKGQSAVTFSKSRMTQKSLLHSRSFKETTTDKTVLQDAIAYHVREAAEELRNMQLRACSLQVSLGTSRHGDYFLQGGSKRAQIVPTNDTFALLKVAEILIESLFKPGVPYKKAGILLTQLTPESVGQLSMFPSANDSKTIGLMRVIDDINEGAGKGSLLLGSRLKTTAWQSSKISQSPDYTTNWKDIAVVKA
jgi:DNA polymerase V